jgi:hypothetical protein
MQQLYSLQDFRLRISLKLKYNHGREFAYFITFSANSLSEAPLNFLKKP